MEGLETRLTPVCTAFIEPTFAGPSLHAECDSPGNAITLDHSGSTTLVRINASNWSFEDWRFDFVTIMSGGGNSTVNVLRTPRYSPVRALGLGGRVTVNVGAGGSVQGIQTGVFIDNRPSFTTLNVDDSADATFRTVTHDTDTSSGLAYGRIRFSGLADASIRYVYTDTDRVTLRTGTGGATVNVLATGKPLTLVGRASSTVNVGNAGSVQGLLGELTVTNPPSFTTLNVDDSADATARTVTHNTFTPAGDSAYGRISGLAPAPISYKYADTTGVTVDTGRGGAIVNVPATGKPLKLIGHGANTTINVGDAGGRLTNILADLTLTNPPSFSTISVDDSSDTTNRTVTHDTTSISGASYGRIRGLAPGQILYKYTDTANVTVRTGLGGATVNVRATGKPLTLAGQAANTTVNVGDAGRVEQIAGDLTIRNYASTTTLTVDGRNDPAGRIVFHDTVTLGGTNYGRIRGLASADILYRYLDTSSVAVDTSAGGARVNVRATSKPLTLLGHGPNTAVNVGNGGRVDAIGGDVSIYNTAPYTTAVTVDDSAEPTARTIVQSTSRPGLGQITGLAPNPIYYAYGTTSSVAVHSGRGGATVNILATGAPLTLIGNGPSTVNLGNGGRVDAIGGDVSIYNTAPSTTRVTVDDSADPTARTIVQSTNRPGLGQITGLAPRPIYYDYASTSSVTVNGGSGGNTITVESTSAAMTLNTGSGNDAVRVTYNFGANNELRGQVTVNGQAGTDTVTLTDPNAMAQTWTVTPSTVTRSNAAAITYGTVEGVTVSAGSGDDRFSVEGNVNSGRVSLLGGAGTNRAVITTGSTFVRGSLNGITGAAIEVQGSLVLRDGITVANSLTLNGGVLNNDASQNVWTGTVHLAANSVVTLTSSTSLRVTNAISGPAGAALTKAGAGTLRLEAANTYAGPTVVSGGELVISSATALGPADSAGTAVHAGGALDVHGTITVAESLTLNGGGLRSLAGANVWNGSINLAVSSTVSAEPGSSLQVRGVIIGAGGLTKAGAGAVILDLANSYAGPTVVAAGTLAIRNGLALGPAGGTGTTVTNNGILELRDGITVAEPLTFSLGSTLRNESGNNALTQPITVTGETTFNVAYGSLEVRASLSGAGQLNKIGDWWLTLAQGSPSYSGAIEVRRGGIALSNDNALGTTGVSAGTTVHAGATLEIRGNITVAEPLVLAGGTLNSYTGANVWSGSITLNSSSSVHAYFADSSLRVTGALTGGGSATLTKAHAGIVFLETASPAFAGPTVVAAGRLIVRNGAALGPANSAGTTVNTGATLDLQFGVTVAESVTLNGGLLRSDLGNNVWNGSITLASSSPMSADTGASLQVGGALTVPANFTLSKVGTGIVVLNAASPSHQGPTVVAAGNLALRNGAALGPAGGNGTTVNSGAVLELRDGITVSEPLTLNGGVLNALAGTSVAWNGSINLTAASSLMAETGASLQVRGVLSGSAAVTLTKAHVGTVLLEAASPAFAGPVVVAAGTLVVRNATALGPANSSTTTVNAGATLELRGIITVNEPLNMQGGTLRSAAGAASWSGSVEVTTTSTFSAVGAELRLGGVVSGAGGLIISGGQVALDRANTYAGPTEVRGGILFAFNDAALGATSAGTTVLPGATLAAAGGVTIAEPLTLGGTLNVFFESFQNAWTGSITLTGAATVANIDTGNLELRGPIFTRGHQLTLQQLAAGAHQTTVSGIISDAGGVTKTGIGTLALTAANTYTGPTVVTAGTLTITNATGLGPAGSADTTVNAGATLELRGDITVSEALRLNGGLLTAASGNVTWAESITLIASSRLRSDPTEVGILTVGGPISGPSSSTLRIEPGVAVFLGGNNSYTGPTVVDRTVLVLTSNTALGTAESGTTVLDGGSLELRGVTIANEELTLNGQGYFDGTYGTLYSWESTSAWTGAISLATSAGLAAFSGSLTVGEVRSGGPVSGLTKRGDGGVEVTAPFINTILTVLEGTLTLNALLNAGTVAITPAGQIVVNDSYLQVGGSTVVDTGSLLIGGILDIQGGSFTVSNGATAHSATSITNAGNVLVDGFTLLATDGAYVQTAGQTLLSNGGVLSAPVIDVQGGVLGGAGTINGEVTNAGRLIVGGTGVAGRLEIFGNYTQTATGQLDIELGGVEQGVDYDVLSIEGTATLDGTLNLALLGAYRPNVDDLFGFLATSGGIAGDFAAFNGLDLGDGLMLLPWNDGFGYYLSAYQQ